MDLKTTLLVTWFLGLVGWIPALKGKRWLAWVLVLMATLVAGQYWFSAQEPLQVLLLVIPAWSLAAFLGFTLKRRPR